MGYFLVYICKSAACLAVYYLFYRWLLARETFHRFNRFALLGLLLLSCLLPVVEVSVHRPTEVHQTVLTLEQLLLLADASSEAEAETAVAGTSPVWIQVVVLLYWAGICFFVCRHAYSLVSLGRLLKRGKREDLAAWLPGREEQAVLIVHDGNIAPFSWMEYILISKKDLEENGREILIHELAHIRNRHSWDLLLADICIFFQWFNPAAWLLKQELQNVHEYEADNSVLEEGVNAREYQTLLIKKAVGTRLYSIANSFNHSKLKKRITMMMRKKSNPWARAKYLYVLPLAAVTVAAFARPEVSEATSGIAAVKVNDLAAIVENKVAEKVVTDTVLPTQAAGKGKNARVISVEQAKAEQIYDVVEEMPVFPGGMPGLMEYLKNNIRYPESAKQKGTQGCVTVQFIIDEEGNVCEPRVLRSVEPELDEEAIRVVSTLPRWEPGKHKGEPVAVKFTLPVMFRQDWENEKQMQEATDEETLILVDGQAISNSLLGAIDERKIEAISVYKDAESLKKYNAEDKKAVMMITLRKKGGEAPAENGPKIGGKVVDEKGEPVIGAAILIEGTKQGTVTDKEGNFKLSLPTEDATLVVSYIGMKTERAKAASSMTVILKAE